MGPYSSIKAFQSTIPISEGLAAFTIYVAPAPSILHPPQGICAIRWSMGGMENLAKSPLTAIR